MTPLEQRIYECALQVIPEKLKQIESKQWTARYVQTIFICDGVMDILIYDTKVKRFTKIRYTKGVGNPLPYFNGNSGIYEQIEFCEFDIPFNN